MKTMKTVTTLAILFSLILTVNAVAGNLTNLPWEGQVTVKTWLEKNSEIIELTFGYQAGNTAQRDHYQAAFDQNYTDLKADGWKETGYHDHRRGEVDITICPTYEEDNVILGTYFYAESYGILMRNGAEFSITKVLAKLAKKSAEQVAFQKAAKKDKGFE